MGATYGEDKRIELANTYFFKARKSLAKGSKDEALQMFRASTAIQEEVYGTYHKRTARSYFFLAQTLFKHTNEYDRALTAYRRAYRTGLSLGADHKYLQGTKRGIREILSDKKSFDNNAVETFFSTVLESVRLEKEGLESTDKKNYDSAIESFEKCFAIEEKAEATFPLDLGHLHVRIAEVYRKKGEHGMAISAYRSALKIYESALGPDYADSKFCLRGIELSLFDMNLSDSVIEEYRESIFVSLSHCEKGDALFDSQKYTEAVSEYEAARLIEEKSLGKYPLTAAYIRRKLGLAFEALEEYDRAILELRTALSINIFECGDDHKSVVATLRDIRSVMGAKGYDFSSVNKYMNTVVFSIQHERFGEHLLVDKKDFSEAIEEFQKSLGLEVSALGKFHLTQGGIFRGIGDAFLQKEVYDFAVVNYRNALVVYQHRLGIGHYYTKSILTSIGDASSELGLTEDQVNEYKEAVSDSIAVEKTAEVLIKDGFEIKAIDKYRKAVRKEGSLIGEYHLCTAHLHGKIAKALKNMGRYDSAIASYRYILAINLRSLGTDHMNTEHAHEDLVDVAMLKGMKREEAVSYGNDAKLSIEHEDNGDEAMIRKNYQSALNNYKKALEKEERFLGDDHLVTEGIIRKILECQKLSGKSDQAFHFYRKMIRIYMKYSSPDYDTEYMLRSLETTVKGLGLDEVQKDEYINIVKESVKFEMSGDSAEESKDYAKAIDSYSRCLLMEQYLLGMLHPSTWSVHKKIGSSFEKSGDFDSAIISHSKALAILESYLGLKEKETVEACNDLLNATLHKINSISGTKKDGSVRDKKNIPSSASLEKSEKKRNKKKSGSGANDVYSVFALLRSSASGEEYNRDGNKMEILKGLTQKWNDLDESGTIIEFNDLGRTVSKDTSAPAKGELHDIPLNFQSTDPHEGENYLTKTSKELQSSLLMKAQGGDSNSKNNFGSQSPHNMGPSFLSNKESGTDVSRELDRANEMANAFKSSEAKNSKLKKTEDRSLSQIDSGITTKKVFGSLIACFSNCKLGTSNCKSGSEVESGNLLQQNPTPDKSSGAKDTREGILYEPNKAQQNANLDKSSGAKETKEDIIYEPDTAQQKTTPDKSSGIKDKREGIIYEPTEKSAGSQFLNMHIPEIPAFNATNESKPETEDEPNGASVSSSSSMSSYESYESL